MKKKKVYKAFLGIDLKKIMPKEQMTGGNIASTAFSAIGDIGNITSTFGQEANVRSGITPRDVAADKGEAIGGLVSTGVSGFLSTFGIPPSISKPLTDLIFKPIGKLIGKFSTSKEKLSKFDNQVNALKSSEASVASRKAYAGTTKYGNVQSFLKGGKIINPNDPPKKKKKKNLFYIPSPGIVKSDKTNIVSPQIPLRKKEFVINEKEYRGSIGTSKPIKKDRGITKEEFSKTAGARVIKDAKLFGKSPGNGLPLATGEVEFDALTQLSLGALGGGLVGKVAPALFSNPSSYLKKAANIAVNIINPITSKSGKVKQKILARTKKQFQKNIEGEEFTRRADLYYKKLPNIDAPGAYTTDEIRNIVVHKLMPKSDRLRRSQVLSQKHNLPDPKLKKEIIYYNSVTGKKEDPLGIFRHADGSIEVKAGQTVENLQGTTYHELVHSLTEGSQNLPTQFNVDVKKLFMSGNELKKAAIKRSPDISESQLNRIQNNYDYLSRPTEVHARMGEIRYYRQRHQGKGVYKKWTPKNLADTGTEMINKGILDPKFFRYMNNENGAAGKSFAKLMNQMFSLSGIVGASLSSKEKVKKFRKGGSLAQGKSVVLDGELHKKGGNDIVNDKGTKVAETEREELLLDEKHTLELEKHFSLFNETNDEIHYIHLGQIMKDIIDNVIDDSGKYS